MMTRRLLLLAAPALVLPRSAPAQRQAVPAPIGRALVGRVNALGLELLAAQAGRGSTVMVSGFSVLDALAPLSPGARGEAAEELRAWLGARGLSELAALHQALAEGGALRRAAALWLPARTPPRPAFTAALRPLRTGVEAVEFADPATLARINAWVAAETGGMIPRLIDRLPANANLVSTAALHFASPWAERFDPAATREGRFLRSNGQAVEAAFLSATRRLPYARGETLHAIRLGYVAAAFELTLLAPRPGASPRTLPDLVRRGRLPYALEALRPRPTEVDIGLPRCTLRHAAELLPLLRRGGLARAFVETADYSGITGAPIRLSSVRQEVALRWDETGTEAAAATGIIGTRAATDRPQFVADRPFLALLTHRPSGLHLMAALIDQPQGDA
jgi:serpin B